MKQIKDLTDEQIFNAIKQAKTVVGKYPYDFLPDYPVKVVLGKMQKMADRDLLDYGVSLRSAWINKED